ncbi:MAG TPA: hypothetical protein V6C72_10385, partial [Chroococcales cyanobacterium]
MRNNIQPEELWSFARKALSFDEPSAKSLRQSRFLRKRSQRNNAREKVTSGEESLLWLELTGAAPADAALDLSRL